MSSQQISDEFKKLNENKFPGTTLVGSNFKQCNRYANILPFDFNTVLLRTVQIPYINASFADYNLASFILTQAPLQQTIESFWAMVYEYQVAAIVKLVEFVTPDSGGWSPAHPYIPSGVGKTTVFGNFSVTWERQFTAPSFSTYQNKEPKEPLTYSSLTIKYLNWKKGTAFTSPSHHVLLLEYNAWPDHGIPSDPLSVIWMSYNLHRYVCRLQVEKEKQPAPAVSFTTGFARADVDRLNQIETKSGHSICGRILVHCSAGVGRTGCFAAVHAALTPLYALLDRYTLAPASAAASATIAAKAQALLTLPLAPEALAGLVAADAEEAKREKGGASKIRLSTLAKIRLSTLATLLPGMSDVVYAVKDARSPYCVESLQQYVFCLATVATVFSALGLAALLPESYQRALSAPAPTSSSSSASLLSVFFQATPFAKPRLVSYVNSSSSASASASTSSSENEVTVAIHQDLPPPLV